jgi:FkbM family methyltransferase
MGAIRRFYDRFRRSAYERSGDARYSRPSINDLDRKLERHLDFDGGVFIEAGANDGYAQSNTYYFEKLRKWSGLLVEPVPELARECRRNRSARVVSAALVDQEVPGATVEIHFANLMSTVSGALGDRETTRRHVEAGVAVQELRGTYTLNVPARTLSALIDEAHLRLPVDLLSLDVEGGEPGALRGLDFSRHAPRFICVEARDEAAIAEILGARYELREVLSDQGTHRDLLYALR